MGRIRIREMDIQNPSKNRKCLTGHGAFCSYTKKIGKRASADCRYCGEGTENTPLHTIVECPKWEQRRRKLQEIVINKDMKMEDITNVLINSSKEWKEISKFLESIMEEKSKDELEEQKEE
ncbi:hypothetical protein TcasGA2_TC012961 [Tribolium castaneum]|uniref:Reverse transcriptase n=1 Tax=Tribolium castaneum TaxID=7070 RepID=D7EKD4_TRICA|nr:hypothetical protein TcasGA2_TC012961 [Tribolium castaneum]